MFNTSKALIAASLFVSLGAVSTTAIAGDITDNAKSQRTTEVSYSDLNLDNPAGQRVLEARISRAAKQVCGSTSGRVSLKEETEIRACVQGAKETAMASLNDNGLVQVAAR